MAKFKPGDPKPANSGRRRGTPNKKTLLKAEEFLANKNVHPVEMLLELLPKLDPADAARTLLELYKFIQPQLKHSESTQTIAPPTSPSPESEEDTDTLLKIVDG